MPKLIEKQIIDFTDELASGAPTPGGGGASALAGALGIALGNMVANLTIGKKRYACVEFKLVSLRAKAEDVQRELLELIEEDAEVFTSLAEVYRMPSDTDDEKVFRGKAMQSALVGAAQIPLEIMKKCAEAIDLIEGFAKYGSRLALSDAACAATLCKSALKSAWINVRVNTHPMMDVYLKEKIEKEGLYLLGEYSAKADAIYDEIETNLR